MSLQNAYSEAMNCTGYENAVTDTEYRLDIDHKSRTILLSFRGSSGFIKSDRLAIDWRQNFRFWHKAYGKFYVHRGLFEKYRSVRDVIFNHLKGLETYSLKIYGFSQGGALAVFAHEDFYYHNFIPITVVFANPRVFGFCGSRDLHKRFKGCTIVHNVNDIVPRIPFIYRHYGTRIKIGKRRLITFPWRWQAEHMGYRRLLNK